MACKIGAAHVDRYVLQPVGLHQSETSFADDVRHGLTSNPKTLPPKYLYDELGSRLFDAICYLPEYYLTRSESQILARYADEIIARSAGRGNQPVKIIELGSGSAEKTRFLIDAVFRRQSKLHYVPVDIAADSLHRSSDSLLYAYTGLSISALEGDYFKVLSYLEKSGIPGPSEARSVALFLGSNIGNFDPDESRRFLRMIRKILSPGDALLMGADIRKGVDLLIPAYDDPLGVTAAFNRNYLVRINRELDGNFDIGTFDHLAQFNPELSRVEMHLVSRYSQRVTLGALDLTVAFNERESIHTESSYKFAPSTLSKLARDTGFELEETWTDNRKLFSFNLLVAAG